MSDERRVTRILPGFPPPVTLFVLLVKHGRVAFPALRRVPRADRSVLRFIGFAAAGSEKNDAQHEQEKPFHGRQSMLRGGMGRSDHVTFNHVAELPAGHDVGDAAVLLDAANNDLGNQLAIATDEHLAVLQHSLVVADV